MHLATQNEELLKQLELEQEYENHLNNFELKLEKAKQEKQNIALNYARFLKQSNKSIADIIKETGLTNYKPYS